MENAQEQQFEKAEIFDTPEQLAASMQAESQPQPEAQPEAQTEPQVETQAEAPTETPYVDPEAAPSEPSTLEQITQNSEPQVEQQPQQEEEYSDEQLEDAVLTFLSERLGRNVESFDEFSQQPAIDERVQAIADFVAETGRKPEDWFTYQSMNTTEMDDVTAIRVKYSQQYPNLSYDEINTLLNSRYKLNPDVHDDNEVRASMIQLKVDASDARKEIETIRERFKAPEAESRSSDSKPMFNEQWYQAMTTETEALEGLEFNLGNDKTFTFSIDNNYKRQLIDKNKNLDNFFDSYVNDNGSWDYDRLNSHLAVIDNIDSIVASAYRQGLGDGQKTIVSNASNVSTDTTPQSSQNLNEQNPLASQVQELLRANSSKVTFRI